MLEITPDSEEYDRIFQSNEAIERHSESEFPIMFLAQRNLIDLLNLVVVV